MDAKYFLCQRIGREPDKHLLARSRSGRLCLNATVASVALSASGKVPPLGITQSLCSPAPPRGFFARLDAITWPGRGTTPPSHRRGSLQRVFPAVCLGDFRRMRSNWLPYAVASGGRGADQFLTPGHGTLPDIS